MIRLGLVALLVGLAVVWPPLQAQDSIVNSPHDLSMFGRANIRAVNEDEICIFCHAPHNSDPAIPAWNRHMPQTWYRIYQSSTLQARLDQPGPESKMCLSCHDGSIAMGLVLSRPPTDPIVMNQPFMPTGLSNLTNDLSDDHPIGFRYDQQLSNRDSQLRPPQLVSQAIKLGPRGELECVACHDPHNNEFGNFLRITDRQGALCTTCHQMNGWRTSAHTLSPRTVPATVTNGVPLEFRSMNDAACSACHVSHFAPYNDRLLRDRPYDLCIGCHNGITATNIESATGLRSGHQTGRIRDVHEPDENPLSMRAHVECLDCHNPHAVRNGVLRDAFASGDTQALTVPPEMEYVSGLSLGGLPVDQARFYYEVCFKCHGDNPVRVEDRIPRARDTGGNVRWQFLPTAASAHPVTIAAPRDGESPSLLPEYRNRQFIGCQDCHNNALARDLGGAAANGPHGSPLPYLLAHRYETADFTVESAQSYALCYQCHDRSSILNDESFTLHNVHVVRGRSPCSACHAPHGVLGSKVNHDHLINFDLSIVSGERRYVDLGRFSGSCTLTCHGVQHVNLSYGPALP